MDSEARSVYWTDWGEGVISRCNVDSGSVSRFGEALTSSRQPFGLAVDPNTDTVMWSSAAQPGIRRADLSGANVRSASEGDRNSWSCKGPWGIALQLRPGCASARGSGTGDRYPSPKYGLGRIFWTSWGRIQCCELANGKVRDVVRGLVDPTGLALDLNHPGGRIFWTDAKAGKVQCAALDGTRVCDVAKGLEEPFGLALGPTHLFWTDRRRGAIQSCCLRTGAVCDVFTDAVSPEGLALLNVRVAAKTQRMSERRDGGRTAASPRPRLRLANAGIAVNDRQLRVQFFNHDAKQFGALGTTPGPKVRSARSAAAVRTRAGGGVVVQKVVQTTPSPIPPPRHKPSVQDIMRLSDNALAALQQEFNV